MLYILIGVVSFIIGLFVGKANSDKVQKIGEDVESKIKTEIK